MAPTKGAVEHVLIAVLIGIVVWICLSLIR
jgi:hypothetical protein